MNVEENEDKTMYKVVVNHEEQYSIWPVGRKKRLRMERCGDDGSQAGVSGVYQGSVDRYAPLSLRKKMEEDATRSRGGALSFLFTPINNGLHTFPIDVQLFFKNRVCALSFIFRNLVETFYLPICVLSLPYFPCS